MNRDVCEHAVPVSMDCEKCETGPMPMPMPTKSVMPYRSDKDLIDELLDPRRLKTEREHAAAREIERIHNECNDFKTIVFHLGEDKRELLDANTKLAGAINLIRESLNGGEVQDLHQIVNAALDAHEESEANEVERRVGGGYYGERQ